MTSGYGNMTHSIIDFLGSQRQHISRVLSSFADTKAAELALVNQWGQDVLDRLIEFTSRGKMIRGALVVLGDSLVGDSSMEPPRNDVLRAAAALELVQSFLLIHDDIMDQDFTRRGKPSIFAQYAEIPRMKTDGRFTPEDAENGELSRRFGEAMGICAGDIAMLLAFELLAGLETDAPTQAAILGMCAREIGWVGVAQMNDVYHGSTSHPAAEEEILNLYRYKTGRYTFSLPLLVGSMLCGLEESDRMKLSSFGEHLGTLFQIKDDDLGIWGDEVETGKPVGSDIAADKQTLHRLYLLQSLNDSERARVKGLFGTEGGGVVSEIRELLSANGVQERISGIVRQHAEVARDLVRSLNSVNARGKELLTDLVEYNLTRRA